jgi:hypothetical protein
VAAHEIWKYALCVNKIFTFPWKECVITAVRTKWGISNVWRIDWLWSPDWLTKFFKTGVICVIRNCYPFKMTLSITTSMDCESWITMRCAAMMTIFSITNIWFEFERLFSRNLETWVFLIEVPISLILHDNEALIDVTVQCIYICTMNESLVSAPISETPSPFLGKPSQGV